MLERWHNLPRSARWALLALALFAFYFGVVERAIDRMNRVAGSAEDWENKLVALRDAQAKAQDSRAGVALGVARHGTVLPPGDPHARAEQLNRSVTRVLASHGVRARTTTSSASIATGSLVEALQRAYPATATQQQVRISRLISEIQFEATPETVSAVVSEFESCPEVAAVSRVQLRRVGEPRERQVAATVVVEAWILDRGGLGR